MGVPGSLSYGRYTTTRNVPSRKGATAHKPLPPSLNATAGVQVNLNPIDPAGVYYCSVNANKGRKAIATTIFMLSDGKKCVMSKSGHAPRFLALRHYSWAIYGSKPEKCRFMGPARVSCLLLKSGIYKTSYHYFV